MTVDLRKVEGSDLVGVVKAAMPSMKLLEPWNDPPWFKWSDGTITVTGYSDMRRTELFLRPESGATIGDVVRCFGSPSYYVVRRDQGPESSGYGYILFYPVQGLVVSHMKYGLFAPSSFGENSPVDDVSLVPRGDIDALLEQQYAGDWLVRMKSDIRKWPTDFATIGMP